MSQKAEFLYFDSKDMVSRKSSEIRDGKAVINDKMFIIDENMKSKILRFKTFFGLRTHYRPFYIIRHDKIVPLEWDDTERKLINPITPTTLKSVIKMRTLNTLMNVKMNKGDIIFYALVFIAIGVLVGFIIGAGVGQHTTTAAVTKP